MDKGELVHDTEKATVVGHISNIHIPPVDFPGFILNADGHIRYGESVESDNW